MRALPEPVAAQAEALRRTTAAAPDLAAVRPDPGIASRLVQACSERRRVRVGYRSEAGSAWAGEVDPWAVVVRHGRWYLLCHAHSSDARRAYRIDRIRDVQVLDAGFDRPADLDPVADLEEHLAVGWEYDVDVTIDAPLEEVARQSPGSSAGSSRSTTAPPGWSAAPATRSGTPSSSRRSRRRSAWSAARHSGSAWPPSPSAWRRPASDPPVGSVVVQHAEQVSLGVAEHHEVGSLG